MIDFTDTLTVFITLVLPALFALAKAATDMGLAYLKTKTPFYFLIDETEVRAKVESALKNSVNYATVKIKESGALTVKVDNQFLLLALEYVKDSVPLALKRLGITDEALVEKIKARL